jgi:hypothetical protein
MWFADSSRFIFLLENKIYISDISTKRLREILAVPSGLITSIAISRDSQLIYFKVRSAESDIWLLDLQ